MRTKTLLIAGAIAVLGSVASYAQVYSQNTVGFYTINMVPGFNLIANQFNNGDNNVNTIMPATSPIPDGTTIQMWDSALQTFGAADAWIADPGGWYDDQFAPSTKVLNPGNGAFVQVPVAAAPFSLVLVGDVPEGELTRDLVPGFQIVSQLTPQLLGFNAAGNALPAADGDVIQFWDTGTQSFGGARKALAFIADPGVWADEDFTVIDPTPAIGEAVFYQRGAAAGNATWTRTFDVSP